MQISPIQINPVKTDAVNQDGRQPSPFQSVREGQVVKADVVDAKGSSLTLKLADGSTVKAEFPGAQVMLPGDQLELTMTSKTDGSIHLRLTTVNGQAVHAGTGELQVRLMDMGVQPSEINTNAAQFLVDRNIQPTPERVALLTKIATNFPELPASVALFMVSNNIPATQQNVNTLLMWLQNGQSMGGEVQQLVDQVTQMIMDQTGQQSTQIVTENQGTQNNQTAQLATGQQNGVPANAQAQAEQAPANDARAALAAAIAQLTNTMAAEHTQPSQIAPVVQQGVPGQVNVPVFVETFTNLVQVQGQGTALENIPQNAVADFAATLATMSEGEAQQAIEGFLSKFSMAPAERNQAAQVLQTVYQQAHQTALPELQQQQTVQTLGENFTQQTHPAVAEQAAQPQTPQGQSVLNQTTGEIQQQAVEHASQTSSAAVQENAVAQELHQVLNSLTKLVVTMRRDVAADAENLQDALKNQQKISDSVQQNMARIAGENNPATQRAADIASKVQMGTQMENFYYCQLPFVMNENQNTAELYIFERKQKGGEGDSTKTTILIALETENMGRVETVMRSELDDLSLEFRVENRVVQQYLEQSTLELSELLESENFRVAGIRVVQIETPATPMNIDKIMGEQENFQLQAVDISI